MEDGSSSSSSQIVTPDGQGSSRIPNYNRNRPATCAVCLFPTQVCHFEVPACQACSTFFRRCITTKKEHKCKGHTNKCYDISEPGPKRPKCKACRLQKCLKVGMKAYCTGRQFYEQQDQNEENENISLLQETYQKVVENCNQVDAEIRDLQLDTVFKRRVQEKLYTLDFQTVKFPSLSKWGYQQKKTEIITSVLLTIEYAKRFQFFHKILVGDRIRIIAYFSILFLNFEKSYEAEISEKDQENFPAIFNTFLTGKINPFEYHLMKTICFFNPAIDGLSESTIQFMKINREINANFLADYCIKFHEPIYYLELLRAISFLETGFVKNLGNGFPNKLSYEFVKQFTEELNF